MKIKKLKCNKCIYNEDCTSKKYYYSILENINEELDNKGMDFICELKCKKYASSISITNIRHKVGLFFDFILDVLFYLLCVLF